MGRRKPFFLIDAIGCSLCLFQLATGFLAQSFFTGFGITLANVSLFVFQTLIVGATGTGVPYGSICSIATVTPMGGGR